MELLKENEVHWFGKENESKAQIGERFNRSLKNRMWRYFTQTHDTRLVKVLPDLMYNYNTTKHRSIGISPQEASLEKNEAVVYKKLYPPEKKVKVQKLKFKVGDHVRTTVKRGDFRKGYRPNFTR